MGFVVTPDRAKALLAECGYRSNERKVVGHDGTVRHLSETMTEAEYDEVMAAWDHRHYGSFNDVLRDIANHRPVWTTERMMVVLAWVNIEYKWDGQPYRRDLGERPKAIEHMVPAVAVWVLDGTYEDAMRAQQWARLNREEALVFVFPVTEEDPIGKGKKLVLQSKEKVR